MIHKKNPLFLRYLSFSTACITAWYPSFAGAIDWSAGVGMGLGIPFFQPSASNNRIPLDRFPNVARGVPSGTVYVNAVLNPWNSIQFGLHHWGTYVNFGSANDLYCDDTGNCRSNPQYPYVNRTFVNVDNQIDYTSLDALWIGQYPFHYGKYTDIRDFLHLPDAVQVLAGAAYSQIVLDTAVDVVLTPNCLFGGVCVPPIHQEIVYTNADPIRPTVGLGLVNHLSDTVDMVSTFRWYGSYALTDNQGQSSGTLQPMDLLVSLQRVL
jgi:hypothetical protein